MKKITLIELTVPHTQAIGIRILSSVAKNEGFDRSMIFMCGDVEQLKPGENKIIQYEKDIIEQVIEIAKGSELVGFSFLTNFFDRAVCLTKAIKEELNIPVIWGGIHATAKPLEALEFADMVCIGEGENSFAELLNRMKAGESYTDVQGIWFKKDGEVIENPDRQLEQDLDKFPFQDYELEGQYFLNKMKGKITPLTVDDLKQLSVLPSQAVGDTIYHYNVMMTRGCPQVCSFCYNSTWREKFSEGKYLRSRTVENLVEELVLLKQKFPFLNFVSFADDNFFAKTKKIVKEFSDIYLEKVNIPFWAQITPLSVDRDKIEMLVPCGLKSISMGVQTANSTISAIYQRPKDMNQKIIRSTHIIHDVYEKYKSSGMRPPQYDFILDSYWETEVEAYENLELLLKFPKPFDLHLASLITYPGTVIYEKAKEENLIKDEMAEIYRRPIMDFNLSGIKRTFPNLLMIYYEQLPQSILKIVVNTKVRGTLSALCSVFVLDKLIKFKVVIEKFIKLFQILRAKDFERLKVVLVKVFKNRDQQQGA